MHIWFYIASACMDPLSQVWVSKTDHQNLIKIRTHECFYLRTEFSAEKYNLCSLRTVFVYLWLSEHLNFNINTDVLYIVTMTDLEHVQVKQLA